MFDISILELIVIALVFLLLLGPDEMATAMRTLGRFLHKAKRFTARIWDEIDDMMIEDEYQEIKNKIMQTDENKDYGKKNIKKHPK